MTDATGRLLADHPRLPAWPAPVVPGRRHRPRLCLLAAAWLVAMLNASPTGALAQEARGLPAPPSDPSRSLRAPSAARPQQSTGPSAPAAANPAPAPLLAAAPAASAAAAMAVTSRARFEWAQQLHRTRQLGFPISQTDVLQRPSSQLTGLRGIEQSWRAASTQNAKAAAALRQEADALARIRPVKPLPESALRLQPQFMGTPGAPRFDWRDHGIVSPVVDQQQCGSCWAFASTSAYEASFKLRNGYAVDVSEQEVLDCTSGSCSGGDTPLPMDKALSGDGLVARDHYAAYSAIKGTCMRPPNTPALRSVAWGYVDAQREMPSMDKLKQALIEHGPLIVGIYANDLFGAYRVPPDTPAPLQNFTFGLKAGEWFEDQLPGADGMLRPVWVYMGADQVMRATDRRDQLNDAAAMHSAWVAVNHLVLLIGWDDRRQAWLIKNSWGPFWGASAGSGTSGYAWVSYGQANVGAYAAWVKAQLKLFDGLYGPSAPAPGTAPQRPPSASMPAGTGPILRRMKDGAAPPAVPR